MDRLPFREIDLQPEGVELHLLFEQGSNDEGPGAGLFGQADVVDHAGDGSRSFVLVG